MNENINPEELRCRIYRGMSFAEKWREVEKLRETAWIIKQAGVRMQHPDWTDEEVENRVKEIFLYATT